MKAPLSAEELPTMAATVAALQRRADAADRGVNWSALTAAFVCPGGGQFVAGRRVAALVVFGVFVVATLVGLVPLFACLWSATEVALGKAYEARPIPWPTLAVGFGVAILVWLGGMLHAAFLDDGSDADESEPADS